PLRFLQQDDPLHEVLLRRRHDGLNDGAGNDVLALDGLNRLFRFRVEFDLDPLVLPVQFVEDEPPQGVDGLLVAAGLLLEARLYRERFVQVDAEDLLDRKSTRLNSSHEWISYAVFC